MADEHGEDPREPLIPSAKGAAPSAHPASRDDLGEDEWHRRGDELSRKLAARRPASAERSSSADEEQGGMSGLAEGLKIASEFIGGIIVGAALGWGVDRLFSTSPFGLIFFLMIGFAAGVLNVIRGVSGPSTTPGNPAKAQMTKDSRKGPP